jgi:hypothetical protein
MVTSNNDMATPCHICRFTDRAVVILAVAAILFLLAITLGLL